MLEFLRLRIFLLMNLNCKPFYFIQKEMLVLVLVLLMFVFEYL